MTILKVFFTALRVSKVENSNESLVYKPEEVRKLLGCSRGVVYSGLRAGTIPCVRVSPRKYLIPKAAFMRWLENGGNPLAPQ